MPKKVENAEQSRIRTEHKKPEATLKDSEAKHKSLIRNIPGMVYRAYPDWSAEVVSGCEKITGYTTVELNSMDDNWLNIIHPDDRKRVFNEGSVLAERSTDLVQIYRILSKSGGVRWVEDRKRSLFSKEGEFIGIDGVVFDITARKRMEAALRKARDALEVRVKEQTAALTEANEKLRIEITQKQQALEKLVANRNELKKNSNELMEMNTTLNVLLEKSKQGEARLRERIEINMNQLVFPYLDELNRRWLDSRQRVLVDMIRSNLKQIADSFSLRLSSSNLCLTRTEIRVADLVRQGLKSREIAELLNLSYKTVESHRENIRKKLGITNKKKNLQTHLLSIA